MHLLNGQPVSPLLPHLFVCVLVPVCALACSYSYLVAYVCLWRQIVGAVCKTSHVHGTVDMLDLRSSICLCVHLLYPCTTCADAFPWGGLATGRCGRHASKQARKALRSQGYLHRTKSSRMLATLKQNKSMYKNTSRYVNRWVKPWIGVRAPECNRHSVPVRKGAFPML